MTGSVLGLPVASPWRLIGVMPGAPTGSRLDPAVSPVWRWVQTVCWIFQPSRSRLAWVTRHAGHDTWFYSPEPGQHRAICKDCEADAWL